MKRRIEITVETQRVTLTGVRRVSLTTVCGRCGVRVLMLTPEEAAAFSGIPSRQIYRWLESGLVHFVEEAGEPLLICTASLGRAAEPAAKTPPAPGEGFCEG